MIWEHCLFSCQNACLTCIDLGSNKMYDKISILEEYGTFFSVVILIFISSCAEC
jgi:hypothetical protein